MVFDGEKGNYSETDTPEPVNFYGKTKLEGENICLKASSVCTVVRITLQYGWGNAVSSSFSDWLIKNLKDGKQAPLFTDQYRTPIELNEAAKIIVELAQMDLVNETINIGGAERVSRFELGEILCSAAGYDKSLLQKITLDDLLIYFHLFKNLPEVNHNHRHQQY